MSKVLFWTGVLVLIAWAVRDLVIYGIGVIFDLRIWLLAVPLYLLHLKIKKRTGEGTTGVKREGHKSAA